MKIWKKLANWWQGKPKDNNPLPPAWFNSLLTNDQDQDQYVLTITMNGKLSNVDEFIESLQSGDPTNITIIKDDLASWSLETKPLALTIKDNQDDLNTKKTNETKTRKSYRKKDKAVCKKSRVLNEKVGVTRLQRGN